ncbi:hypothetical protein TNCV_1143811 [Trichonephila clavipes]|nr:hypothetical protein TNCV_1143811 [Trichonephila clavipes]
MAGMDATSGKRISELDLEWCDSHGPKKFKTQLPVGKRMLTAFFEVQGPLLQEFKKPDVSSHANNRPKHLINYIIKAIKNKHIGILSSCAIILHDNASPQFAKVCVEALSRKSVKFWSIHLAFQICRLATV